MSEKEVAKENTVQRILMRDEEVDGDVETDLEDLTKFEYIRRLSIFMQLLNSERFREFLNNNFVVRDFIDDEKQEIDTLVIENPIAVGPRLTGAQISQLYKIMSKNKNGDVKEILRDVLIFLGQEPPSLVLTTGSLLS